jgi:hypothetical protein
MLGRAAPGDVLAGIHDSLDALVDEDLDGGCPKVPDHVGDGVAPPHEQVIVQIVLPAAQVAKAEEHEHAMPAPVNVFTTLNNLPTRGGGMSKRQAYGAFSGKRPEGGMAKRQALIPLSLQGCARQTVGSAPSGRKGLLRSS